MAVAVTNSEITEFNTITTLTDNPATSSVIDATEVFTITPTKDDGKVLIEIDSKYFRPTEVELLLGDPSKAKEKLGWSPKVTFKELVKMMVEADMA